MPPDQLIEYLIIKNYIPNIVVSESTNCWYRSRKSKPEKYVRLKFNGIYYSLHVLSATLFLGFNKLEKPGQYICHKCDNGGCCNPNHLYIGTAVTNSNDKKYPAFKKPVYDESPLIERQVMTCRDIDDLKEFFEEFDRNNKCPLDS